MVAVFVVIERVPVAKGMEAEFEERARRALAFAERMKGFRSREVLRPVEGDRFAVITRWETRAHYEGWLTSPEREAGLADLPAGLFAGNPEVCTYEAVAAASVRSRAPHEPL